MLNVDFRLKDIQKRLIMNLLRNFIDFAKNSSIHGIKYTVDSTTSILERLFWIMVIILSVSFSAYLTILFWSRYMSNPTRTVVETNVASITTGPFPGITICNINKVLESKLEAFLGKLDANIDELLVIKNTISKLLINDAMTNISQVTYNMTELAITDEVLEKNGYADITRILRRISPSCDEMITKCVLNKKQIRCQEIFQDIFTIHGRCCSFNYVKTEQFIHTLYTMYYGSSTGLNVILTPGFNNRSMAGVTVTVHNPQDFPNGGHNIKKRLPLARINYMQIQGLKRKCSDKVKNLDIIHRHCINSNERNLDYFNSYTYSNCLSLHEALAVIDRCQCVPYYYGFIYEKPICGFGDLTCVGNITGDRIKTHECPSQCEEDSYDIILTTVQLFNNSKKRQFDQVIGINDTKNVILLNIYFTTNKQSIWLRDTITSGIYLVSSFGGIYSLFLGCSLITVVEILYYSIARLFVQNICSTNEISEQKDKEVGKIFTFHSINVPRKVDQPKYYSQPIIPYVN